MPILNFSNSTRQRDIHGRYIKNTASKTESTPKNSDPPLLDLVITNPITYIKLWWKKVMQNEGIDFRFRIKPLTAIAMCAVLGAMGFGLGRFVLPSNSVMIKYIPQFAPSPTPNPWKDTAFTGILRFSDTTKKFFLEVSPSQVITLEIPKNVSLTKYIGRRILADGKLNTQTGILIVMDASDLELLPTQVSPIPTIPVTPNPSPVPSL